MRKYTLTLLCVLLIGFHTPVSAQDDSSRLTILTTTSIMADVVANVAGDTADVSSLMGYDTNPHAFQPTPQDIVALDDADIVFVNGANFEATLAEVIEEAAGDNVYVLSTCVEILVLGGENQDSISHEDADSENPLAITCAEHFTRLGLAEDDSTLGHLYAVDCVMSSSQVEHAHGSCDPHIWLDPQNVMLWTLLARDVLSERDPANAEIYAANAEAYLAELVTLDTELEAQFAEIPVENRILVTNHDVLGYFAHRYDFTIVGTVLANPDGEPSIEDLIAITELIDDTGATAIFTDNTMNNTLAKQIAEETGVEVYPLYTDSLSEETPTYLEYMRHNAGVILEGIE